MFPLIRWFVFLVLCQTAVAQYSWNHSGRQQKAICRKLTSSLTSCVQKYGHQLREACLATMFEDLTPLHRPRRNRRKGKCMRIERKFVKRCGCTDELDSDIQMDGLQSAPLGDPEGTHNHEGSGSSRSGLGGLKLKIPNTNDEDLVPNVSCYLGDGGGYLGDVSNTVSGIPCQNWEMQEPHAHSRTPDNYPGLGLGNHNSCRNPDSEIGPWCYSTDPEVRWEVCEIAACPEIYDYKCQRDAGYMYRGDTQYTIDRRFCDPDVVKTTTTVNYLEGTGANYAGTISVTENGRPCKKWNDVDYQRLNSYGDHNYCRNPNGLSERPWCFVSEESFEWEYCDVPGFWDAFNDADSSESTHPNLCRNSPFDDQMSGVWCYNGNFDRVRCVVDQCKDVLSNMEYHYDCMKLEDQGVSYRGNVSNTISGKLCQNWSTQFPHEHSMSDPRKGVGDHNHCRNPDNEPLPWCYTVDPDVRWDFCSIPYCSYEVDPDDQPIILN